MKNQNAFTLLELLITIVVIGILTSIAIPKFFDITAKAKCTEVTITLSTFERLKSFHYEAYGDDAATLDEIGLKLPDSKWFDYNDIVIMVGDFNTGGNIGTAAVGGVLKDEGTIDADGNNGHGNDDDSCDSSNPGNPCPGINPAGFGSLYGHTLAAVANGQVGNNCSKGMGIYSNWHPSLGLTRGDVSGGTCTSYMHSFVK